MTVTTSQLEAAHRPANLREEPSFLEDAIRGLSQDVGHKFIPSRYLYDERGCELFEKICETPEYYPTRTELSILDRDAEAIAKVCGPNCRVVELGSGASIKTEMLLEALESPAMYVPVDIAPEYLAPAVEKLSTLFPAISIQPVCANFTQPFELPDYEDDCRTIVYFPGSTIGNFTRPTAIELLSNMRELGGPEGGLLIGMDLKKDVDLLAAAYNDAAGVTDAFTNNLLTRLQRELGAELDEGQFEHFARYNVEKGRIEIYLCSVKEQLIRIGDREFPLESGELINTEYSYKYDLNDVQNMANAAGVSLTHAWLDESNWFGVFFFSCAS